MARIAELIMYEGDNSTFIWKHPSEDFNTMTQLIVHESQEAIFFMNGQALDTFGPGRHTLETENIPLLSKLIGKLTGNNDTPFHCQVYFINKTVQMAIKWGTDSKVRFIEPTMGLPVEIGACGEMNLQICDGRKMLIQLVGTLNGISWGEQGPGFAKSLQASFRPLISTAVKTHLASSIKGENIDILEIDENLERLSESLRKKILPGFEEYGLTVPQLYITSVMLPENDPNFKLMRELHTVSFQAKAIQADTFIKTTQADADAHVTAARRRIEMERQTTQTEVARQEAERELIRAQAEAQAARMAGLVEAEVMQAKGYSQKDVLQAEVQMAYAEGLGQFGANGGGGGMVSDFVSLGVGLAAAGQMGAQVGNMFQGFGVNNPAPAPAVEPAAPAAAKCGKCGADLHPNAKFCLECGEKVVPAGQVVCPGCGSTVPKGKFCPECGHRFSMVCPNCGQELTPGAKFCLECGTKI